MTTDGSLEWLMNWFVSHCDDEWEHGYGITIETLDNPGWRLSVDLSGTDLEGRQMARLERDIESDVSWSCCWVADKKFEAACGPRDLHEVIGIFRRWTES